MTGMLPPDGPAAERREKVLNFVEKDIFVVNNYESMPFKNKNHAIECLIPYHLFQVLAEDIKFKGSTVDISIDRAYGVLRRRLLALCGETCFIDEQFTPQLLLYHEQRYINSLLQQRAQEPAPQITTVRLPRARRMPAYGPPYRLRLRRKPLPADDQL